jgi:hypothetical protein
MSGAVHWKTCAGVSTYSVARLATYTRNRDTFWFKALPMLSIWPL